MISGNLLGCGRTAKVFALDDGKIAKVFCTGCEQATADYEHKVSRAVASSGLPVPQVHGLATVNGCHAIIYERIDGPTMLQTLLSQPGSVSDIAQQLAELQHRVHACRVDGLPPKREALQRTILRAKLTPSLERKVLALLNRLPDGEALCHGDFHPGNIILSKRGPVLIDWNDASSGHPLADAARTALLLQTAAIPGEEQQLRPVQQQLHDIYLEHYLYLSSHTRQELEDWQIPVAAARLAEGVPGERESLLSLLAERVEYCASARTT